MNQSKLIRLLASMKYIERKKFRSFLVSPYFNTQELLVILFDLIEEHFFTLGNMETGKEYLWEKIYPEEVYNDTRMRLLMSDLLKHAEEFLAYHSFGSNHSVKRYHLLKELNARDQNKHFNSVLKSAFKSLQKQDIRNSEYYLDRHLLAKEEMIFAYRQQDVRSQKTDFSETGSSLDHYYLSAKLRYFCEVLTRRNVIQGREELVLLEEILQHLRSRDYLDIPPIPVYYNILMLLREEENDVWYHQLKTVVSELGHHFPKEERWDIYGYAINHCIKKANSGELSYLNEMFDWYRSALEQGLLYKNNHLMHWDYKNIASVGLRVGDFDWVQKFNEDYKSRLPAKYRKNAYTYNMARYHFARKNYDTVLRLLQRVEYEDVFYHMDSKTILMKIYYEQEETDSLYSLFDSFGIWLRRNSIISEYHRTNNLNLIRFLKKLISIPHGEKERFTALETSVRNVRAVTDITWLLDQITEKKNARDN